MLADSSNSISLWTTLHDGVLEALRSDVAARTLSFVIDSSFHREFHHLPDQTRIEIIGNGVRSVGAFAFEPWPRATEPPKSTPWEEAEEQRRLDSAKGRLLSTDWSAFATQVGTDEEHIIMTAEFAQERIHSVLRLGINSYPHSEYRDIEVRAEQFRFVVGDQELSMHEFEQFGDAYWNDRSKRSVKSADKTDTSQVQEQE